MQESFSRTEQLLGRESMDRLAKARVAVFGIGGVGGYAVEALARAGVGSLDLFDHDTVAPSNLNRQIVATTKTIGRLKVEVMRERILEINPNAIVTVHDCFYLPENAEEYDLSVYTYILDAVDTVTAKIELAVRASHSNTPLISCMGAGNKLDPTRFEVADLYSTSVCPLAKVMRKELKARGISALKVVYSKEPALRPEETCEPQAVFRRSTPGSVSFVPSVAGLVLAGEVIKDISL